MLSIAASRLRSGGEIDLGLVDVGDHDQPRTAGSRQANVETTDRSRAEHDDDIALTDLRELLSVQDASERLREARLLERVVLGDAVDPVDVEHLAGHPHELGEASVVLVADGLELLADGVLTASAEVADTAGDRRDDLHPIPDRPVLHARAHLRDLSGHLVTEDSRQRDVVVPEAEDLRVRATCRAPCGPG